MPTETHLIQQAFALANRYVVAEIECNCISMRMESGQRWYDTRAFVDPREHSPETLDMAEQALAYAQHNRLVERHPQQPYLVRITAAGLAV